MILALDDSTIMQKTYVRALEGIDTILACGGTDTKAVLQKNNDVSLILMETKYTGASTTEILDILKDIVPDAPIVLITNDEESFREENFSNWGISHFLVKPVDLTVLVTTVRHLIAQK